MKKLTTIAISIFVILIFSYVTFLTLVPMYLQIKISKSKIFNAANELTQLKFDSRTIKFYTTNTLNIGIIINEMVTTYSDDKPFAKVSRFTIETAAIPLLFKTIDLKSAVAENADIDFIILETKKTKITDYLDSYFKPENLTYIYPKLKGVKVDLCPISIKNYKIITTDVLTGNYDEQVEEKYTFPKKMITDYIKPYFTPAEGQAVITIK